MSRIDGLRHRLRVLFSGDAYSSEVQREMRFRQELAALARAGASLGNETYYREEVRRMTLLAWTDRLKQDAVYAARGLRRAPGFTAAIAITLGLGLGVNAAMFTLLDRIFVRAPTGVPRPLELRRVYREMGNGAPGIEHMFLPGLDYPQFRAMTGAFRDRLPVAAYGEPDSVDARTDSARYVARSSLVTSDYFSVLAIKPQIGRFFIETEHDVATPARVAVISDRFWRRAFDRAPSVLGRTFKIRSERYTIVGVAPRDFDGLDLDAVDFWLPENNYAGSGGNGGPWYLTFGAAWHVVTRLPRSASDMDVARIATNAIRPVQLRGLVYDPSVRAVTGSVVAATGPASRIKEVPIAVRIGAIAVLVFVIAWANALNLLLLRATQRGREIAVRRALGVSRARLVGQLTVESAMVAVISGAVALLGAFWAGAAVRRLMLPRVQWGSGPVDARSVVFVAIASVLVAAVGGFLPAWQVLARDITKALKSGAPSASYHTSSFRAFLLAFQVALCVVLLVGAGLLIRSFDNVRSIGVGFETADRLFVRPAFDDPAVHVPELRTALTETARRLRELPGVEAVGLTVRPPLGGASYRTLRLPGRESLPTLPGDIGPSYTVVSPDYFKAVGLSMLSGRDFRVDDRPGAPRTAIVNEAMARTYWPGKSAVGKCMLIDKETSCLTVVGVVADGHRMEIVEGPSMQWYLPLDQRSETPRDLIIHTRPGATAHVLAQTEAILRPLVTDMTGLRARTFESVLEPQLRPWALGAKIVAALALLALSVAAVGVYSVVAYAVSQRTHEMGIRIALGAERRDILDLVVGDGMRPIVAGLLVGIIAALLLGRFIASLLFGIMASDAGVLIGSAAVLVLVAGAGCLIPGWRAAAVDPIRSLRVE